MVRAVRFVLNHISRRVKVSLKMADTLRQRKSQTVSEFSVGAKVLHTLEDFQARIDQNLGPNDKPPIEEPLVPPNPNSLTLAWNEIPPWQQDNEYILTGYRRFGELNARRPKT